MRGDKNRSVMTVNDIMQSATVAVTAGQFNKIGQFVMPAGYYKAIGYGGSSSQSDAQGRMYVQLQNASPVEVKGKFRIEIYNPTDRSMKVLDEWHTSSLDSNATDRTKQIALPEKTDRIAKDWKYVFFFQPDASDTIVKANCTIFIDCTDEQTV
jgi:hypothetical protein